MAGTAKPSNLGVFAWSAESSFADTSADTVSTHMILRDDAIDLSGLSRPLVDRGGVYMVMNDGEPNVPGAYGAGSFTTTFDLYGHGTTTAGALTQTNLHKLLAHVFGGADATNNGGVDAGTGDADSLNTDGGSELFTPGAMLRVGALGDGRGGGQCYAVDATTGTPNTVIDLLTGMSGAANDGDVVYAMQHIWPATVDSESILASSGATANNTLRIALKSANLQYICRGCVATAVELSGLSAGEIPQIAITWQCVAWEPISTTFLAARTTADNYPSVTAAGSLFLQAYGTSTRATDIARNFSFTVGMQTQALMGSGGASAGQNIVGWRRLPARSSISFDVEAEAVTASPTWHTYHSSDPNAITLKHVLLTLNPHDGRAIGLYFPRCRPSASVPTQNAVDNLNYVTVTLEPLATESASYASTVEIAPWVMSMG